MVPADIVKRLKSRKFWAMVTVGFIVVFGEELGIDLDEQQLWQLVSVVAAWLGIQGVIDYKNGNAS